jgi:hypothetical protein
MRRQRSVAGFGVLLAAVFVVAATLAFAVTSAGAADRGPVPPRLAGLWAATLPNYPDVGLYKGRRKLNFGPDSKMQYIRPYEGPLAQGVSVNGSRITFMLGGECAVPGTYIWRVTGQTLTFTKVQDTCRKRAVLLVRKWTRVR